MKITRIELYQVDLPYAGGVYHLSGGREYRSFDATMVRILTDTGLEGWGRARRSARPILRLMPLALGPALPR
ncbi:hypothetical protein MBH78_18065 [Oceanimonas sp. NS1]|nr:hypothetical protein [Oceanimonas sp. NS1]